MGPGPLVIPQRRPALCRMRAREQPGRGHRRSPPTLLRLRQHRMAWVCVRLVVCNSVTCVDHGALAVKCQGTGFENSHLPELKCSSGGNSAVFTIHVPCPGWKSLLPSFWRAHPAVPTLLGTVRGSSGCTSWRARPHHRGGN